MISLVVADDMAVVMVRVDIVYKVAPLKMGFSMVVVRLLLAASARAKSPWHPHHQ